METEASLCATPVDCGGMQYKWHKQEASFGMRARGHRHSQLGTFRLRAKAARLSSKGCTRADPQLWMSKGLGCAWASPVAAASEKCTKVALAPELPCPTHGGAGTCTVSVCGLGAEALVRSRLVCQAAEKCGAFHDPSPVLQAGCEPSS